MERVGSSEPQRCNRLLYGGSKRSLFEIIVATEKGISNIVIVYCYASIVVKRGQSMRTVRAASSHQIQPSVNDQDMKLLLQIRFLYIIFTVSWVLLGVSATVHGGHNAKYRVFIEMSTIAVIINSSVNLFIYLIFSSAFRKEAGRLLCCFKNPGGTVSTGPTASNSNYRKQRTEASSVLQSI